MARRIVACIGFGFGLVMFLVMGTIASGYLRRPNQMYSLDDWTLFLLPPFSAMLAAIVSITLFSSNARNAPWVGAMWGLFIGTQSFLVLLAYHLLTRSELIAADGTAYWGKLYLPTLVIGIPISVVGMAAGAVVALALDSRHRRGARDHG